MATIRQCQQDAPQIFIIVGPSEIHDWIEQQKNPITISKIVQYFLARIPHEAIVESKRGEVSGTGSLTYVYSPGMSRRSS